MKIWSGHNFAHVTTKCVTSLNHVDYSHIDTNALKMSIMSSQTLYEMRPGDSYAVD